MARRKSEIVGKWHIQSMDQWDEEYLNMEIQAYIEFKPDQTGSFQFGLVQGCLDYRTKTQDNKPLVEFSWEGSDECDPASGRGWAAPDGPKLTGMIFIHLGDESGFIAVKA